MLTCLTVLFSCFLNKEPHISVFHWAHKSDSCPVSRLDIQNLLPSWPVTHPIRNRCQQIQRTAAYQVNIGLAAFCWVDIVSRGSMQHYGTLWPTLNNLRPVPSILLLLPTLPIFKTSHCIKPFLFWTWKSNKNTLFPNKTYRKSSTRNFQKSWKSLTNLPFPIETIPMSDLLHFHFLTSHPEGFLGEESWDKGQGG